MALGFVEETDNCRRPEIGAMRADVGPVWSYAIVKLSAAQYSPS